MMKGGYKHSVPPRTDSMSNKSVKLLKTPINYFFKYCTVHKSLKSTQEKSERQVRLLQGTVGPCHRHI